MSRLHPFRQVGTDTEDLSKLLKLQWNKERRGWDQRTSTDICSRLRRRACDGCFASALCANSFLIRANWWAFDGHTVPNADFKTMHMTHGRKWMFYSHACPASPPAADCAQKLRRLLFSLYIYIYYIIISNIWYQSDFMQYIFEK
jgi:hypothetical protein